MPPIATHEPNKKSKVAKKTRLTLADMPHVADSAPFMDIDGVVEALFRIAHSLKSYNVNACDGNFSLGLFTGAPLRLLLEGNAVDSIADSLKRIADAIAAQHGRG